MKKRYRPNRKMKEKEMLPSTTTVYLIRHAKTSDDHNGMTQNDNSEILVDTAVKSRAKQIKELVEKCDGFYCSTMNRAKQTANLIHPVIWEETELAREYTQPKFMEKMKYHERYEWWDAHPEARSNPNWSEDGSESFRQMQLRALKFWDFIKQGNHNKVAVVTHSNFMKHLLLARLRPDYTTRDFYELVYPLTIENMKVIELTI